MCMWPCGHVCPYLCVCMRVHIHVSPGVTPFIGSSLPMIIVDVVLHVTNSAESDAIYSSFEMTSVGKVSKKLNLTSCFQLYPV